MENTASVDFTAAGAAYWERIYGESRAEPDYDGWLNGVEIPSGAAVLDLGCGAGADTEALLRRGATVTAADLSQSAVALVRERFGEGLSGADCFDMRDGLPYADGRFDMVVADLSLHYFCWADTERIVAEIARVLRGGGRLAARVHSLRNLDSDATASLETLEEGYFIVEGYSRRYFREADVRALFSGWRLTELRETLARRYGMRKRVIAFIAERK